MSGDDFKGAGYVDLQRGSRNVPVVARFIPATISTANDGSIPYGSSLISATWKWTGPNQTTASTSELISDNNRNSSNNAYTYLSWSSNLVNGRHKLTCIAIFGLSGVSTTLRLERDLDRIYVRHD